MSNCLCPWSSFSRQVPGLCQVLVLLEPPKQRGGSCSMRLGVTLSPPCPCQPDPRAALVLPRPCTWLEVWDGTRTPVGAARVRDRTSFAVIVLLAVYEWSRPFPRAHL